MAIPRHADAAEQTGQAVRRAVELFTPYLGPRYTEEALVRQPMSTTGAILAEWFTPDGSNAIRISRAWSVSTAPNVSLRIIRSVDSSAGRLRLKNPVWGSYATIVGRYDSDRMFAWATVPGIEAIHYAYNDAT